MDPIFKTSYLGFKVLIYSSYLSYKEGFLGKEITIPFDQIASIEAEMPGIQAITIETTGGKKIKIIVNLKEKQNLINAIHNEKFKK